MELLVFMGFVRWRNF